MFDARPLRFKIFQIKMLKLVIKWVNCIIWFSKKRTWKLFPKMLFSYMWLFAQSCTIDIVVQQYVGQVHSCLCCVVKLYWGLLIIRFHLSLCVSSFIHIIYVESWAYYTEIMKCLKVLLLFSIKNLELNKPNMQKTHSLPTTASAVTWLTEMFGFWNKIPKIASIY